MAWTSLLEYGVLGLCAGMITYSAILIKNEQKRKEEARKQIIKIIQTFMALCVFLAIINAAVQIFQVTETPIDANAKPLEGIWSFTMEYSRFHGKKGTWTGDGQAVILWKHEGNRYDIYFGSIVIPSGESTPILVGFSIGKILANEEGWPTSEPFTIDDVKYISRMHRDGRQPSKLFYTIKNATYTSLDDRVNNITAKFDTGSTEGTMTFKWENPLH